jgi:uncharacterized protein YacL
MKTSTWIKLNNWKDVKFPEICPFSGLKTDTTKDYYVYNTSILWHVMRILQLLQYIVLPVPFSHEGLKEMKRQRTKAILKGLLIGAVFAIVGLVIGVYISVEAPTKQVKDLGTILGGCTFVFSLILGPFILDYQLQKKTAPLDFKKKDRELWVMIRNEDYKKRFLILNDFMRIADTNFENDEILDHSID